MSETNTDSNNDYPKQVDYSQLQIGDYLSEVHYYQVIEVDSDKVQLRDQQGKKPLVDKDLVEAGMYAASQYTKEVIVTRTELINIFTHSYNVVFTVNFNKQLKESDLTQKLVLALSDLEEIKGSSKQVKSLLRKTIKENIEGEKRTLIGYLIQPEPLLGRSKVIDLEIPLNKMPVRYVDHRTLNWLIVKNVKYTIKSSSKSSENSESSHKVDLSQDNLSGVDLRGADLSNRNLQSYNFTEANLSGANLSHSDLSECSFLKANLSHANLSFAKLGSTNFTEADLSNADLSYSSPEEGCSAECYFTQANLTNANLEQGDLTVVTSSQQI